MPLRQGFDIGKIKFTSRFTTIIIMAGKGRNVSFNEHCINYIWRFPASGALNRKLSNEIYPCILGPLQMDTQAKFSMMCSKRKFSALTGKRSKFTEKTKQKQKHRNTWNSWNFISLLQLSVALINTNNDSFGLDLSFWFTQPGFHEVWTLPWATLMDGRLRAKFLYFLLFTQERSN